jgi:uncharacterized protein
MPTAQFRPVRRRNRFTRIVGCGFLSILLLLVVFVGAVGWIASDRALSPTLGEVVWSLDDYPSLQPEPVIFESQTGVELEGRFFPGNGDAVVILLHGFSGRQDQVLPQAAILNEVGFHILTYDGRHPVQYGDDVFSTLGVLERHDLVSAVDYLVNERPEVDPDRIGVYGTSLGGATAILGGALDPRLNAIAAEGAFSDGDSVVDSSFERYIGLPAFPFGPVARSIAEWRAGANLNDARPVDAIVEIQNRPVLLIHGDADVSVPPDHGERILTAGGDNVELWRAPGAGHFDAHQVLQEEYAERLTVFFDRALRQ